LIAIRDKIAKKPILSAEKSSDSSVIAEKSIVTGSAIEAPLARATEHCEVRNSIKSSLFQADERAYEASAGISRFQ